MANLLLTNYCNRQCPYCFAVDAMQESETRSMTFREIVHLADQTVASGMKSIGLLGGEPTLHPQFVEIVTYFLAREVTPRIFTNGLAQEAILERLDALPKGRFRFIVNVNAPKDESEHNRKRQLAFLRRFAECCDLGVNVYEPDMDLSFLIETAAAADLRSNWIRVGIAQPIVGESNEYLPLEHYEVAACEITTLAKAAFARRIRLVFDCGFPLCAFTDEQLGALYRCSANLKFVCQSAVDIAPGGDAWSCFPLARQTRRAYGATTSVGELRSEFARDELAVRRDLPGGVFEACSTCVHRKLGACHGGCLSHLLCREPSASASS